MKGICVFIVIVLFVVMWPIGVSANVTPLTTLSRLEELVYGETRVGALVERVDRIEEDIYGSKQSGAVLTRIDNIHSFLDANHTGTASIKLQLNLAEYGFSAKLTAGQPLIERLDQLEIDLLGAVQPGSLSKRTRELMTTLWVTTQLDIKSLELREQTLVKIRLLTEVDSANARVGDEVRYRVSEDVIVEGRIVIPAGSEGIGRVAEVTTAGMLGRDGRIVINFGMVSALDGSSIRLKMDAKATERNHSLELAAGASMAGILLLGPIGLVGGYFIRGRDVAIPVGTEFFVETERTQNVIGFILRPAQN